MRIGGVLLILLALSACVGPSRERPRARTGHRPPLVAAQPSADIRQCLAQLPAAGVLRYNRLPDRVFSGGCSAIGTIQLLDIGLPVTNLGAMRCPLAERFSAWVNQALQNAAMAWLDARIARIESMGTYSCRPVNGQSGNKLSEHGLSNAVDISAFILESGRRITVKNDWNGPDENARNFLRAVHKAGCRRFGVTLGPDANALHHDHFHFDMSRAGGYCR